MSARSDAWYADPENREKRKANMLSYSSALVELGRRYPAHRRRVYRREVKVGRPAMPAYQRALAEVRNAHRAEFRMILDALREAA